MTTGLRPPPAAGARRPEGGQSDERGAKLKSELIPYCARDPEPSQGLDVKDLDDDVKDLQGARKVFRRWFGDDYDTDALDAMLATAAVEKFDDGSDPVWLLIISGPGAAKTETVQSLDGVGATVTSTLTSGRCAAVGDTTA
ncbi:MAG: hypothetical protein ACLPR9_16195 [Acidimicrobiales bacterium]